MLANFVHIDNEGDRLVTLLRGHHATNCPDFFVVPADIKNIVQEEVYLLLYKRCIFSKKLSSLTTCAHRPMQHTTSKCVGTTA